MSEWFYYLKDTLIQSNLIDAGNFIEIRPIFASSIVFHFILVLKVT